MENKDFLKDLLQNLKKPIPAQWRVQSYHKTKPQATVMAYIDARDAMELLDNHASYGWHREHYQVENKVYCRVGIVMPDASIQWRSDCGTESNQDAEKGQASDSFKRACVNWGIGRFLYDLKVEYLTTDKVKEQGNYPNCIDENGAKIWDINEYVNNKAKGVKPKAKVPPELLPNTDQWNEAVKYLQGSGTIEKIKGKYTLSEDNEEKLKAEVLEAVA